MSTHVSLRLALTHQQMRHSQSIHSKEDFKNNFKITILTIENYNGVWFKDICETIVSNCGSKENCKTIVCDYDFQDIFETIVKRMD